MGLRRLFVVCLRGASLPPYPFLPIATIGTAVAFYIGFKNNAAYDRFWEGRKIWGGVVNESRMYELIAQADSAMVQGAITSFWESDEGWCIAVIDADTVHWGAPPFQIPYRNRMLGVEGGDDCSFLRGSMFLDGGITVERSWFYLTKPKDSMWSGIQLSSPGS